MSLYVSPRHPSSYRIRFSLSLLFSPQDHGFCNAVFDPELGLTGSGHCYSCGEKTLSFLKTIVTLAYSFLVFVCLILIGPSGNLTIF